jgi:surface protein
MTTVINNRNIRNLVKLYCTNQKNMLPEDLRNTPIGQWDVSQVTNMNNLFEGYQMFNEPLESWNMSNVTSTILMFHGCKNFNQPLNNWNMSNVVDTSKMFLNCHVFNQPLNNWDMSNVDNINGMFFGCMRFNQSLNDWNVSNVNNMSDLFNHCKSFNQPLNNWNVSNVTDMNRMFYHCETFNQQLDEWDVSNVTDMNNMFSDCNNFNQPLNKWNVSNVTDMANMFYFCINFNQPLDQWDVSNVTDMSGMFHKCWKFDQPLNNWNLSSARDIVYMFLDCPISEENKPRRLNGQQPIQRQQPADERQQYLSINTPLENSSLQINPSSQIGSDLINMERDINVLNFMNEDPKNIAFYFHNQIYLTNKDSLHYSITDPENKGKNIKYECLRTGSMNPNNIVYNNPYFSMRTVGSYGLVSLSQINEIIQNESIRYVEMTKDPIKQLISTASLQATGPNPNYVSASHCQEGQGENVYNLLNIVNVTNENENQIKRPKLGGKKRTKKRHKRRTKKRNTKKLHKKTIKNKYITNKK